MICFFNDTSGARFVGPVAISDILNKQYYTNPYNLAAEAYMLEDDHDNQRALMKARAYTVLTGKRDIPPRQDLWHISIIPLDGFGKQ